MKCKLKPNAIIDMDYSWIQLVPGNPLHDDVLATEFEIVEQENPIPHNIELKAWGYGILGGEGSYGNGSIYCGWKDVIVL